MKHGLSVVFKAMELFFLFCQEAIFTGDHGPWGPGDSDIDSPRRMPTGVRGDLRGPKHHPSQTIYAPLQLPPLSHCANVVS